MSATQMRRELTQYVIDRLSEGIPPSRILWNPGIGGRLIRWPVRWNGQHYRGGNLLRLSLKMIEFGFQSPYWLTIRQADQLGAELRKGAKGTEICYCGASTKLVKQSDGTKAEKQMFFERSFLVFNAEQFRGLPLKYHAAFQPSIDDDWGITKSDDFFRHIQARVQYGGRTAFYSPCGDYIQMPHRCDFIDAEAFQSVLCHEHIHWTGHFSRLDRHLERSSFGNPEYAAEELVAELGAAFFCTEYGITPAIREDHISYIGNWLEVLRNDDRAVFFAANRASDALDYLQSFQPQLQVAC